MISYTAMKESLNPLDIFRKWKYDIDFYRNNPFYFRPDGLVIFVGGQGTGKTQRSELCQGDYPIAYYHADWLEYITDVYINKLQELKGENNE